jgi:PIN domain nuclease of toxin-antitoxin system
MKKYALALPYEDFFRGAIDDNGFNILPIEPRHTASLTTLPYHHKDPFDRLIIAQAMVENVSVVSVDSNFDAYRVTRLW